MIFNKNITLIGSGNVATHLGRFFFKNGFKINEVFSKNLNNAQKLAEQINGKPINNISEINSYSDVYIICVKDDVIAEIARQLPFKQKTVVHTSGSVSINTLQRFTNHGIFYPLQTFSKEKKVNISEVPFCIEANNIATERLLVDLAKTLSQKVYLINSEQRKKIHLAAVFACNFTNFMYQIAHDITTKSDIDFDILKPLILETAKKINHTSPILAQTGPAKREDEKVIQNHLKMLSNNKDYQEIYRLISNSIKKNS